jgi:hypothetical protein
MFGHKKQIAPTWTVGIRPASSDLMSGGGSRWFYVTPKGELTIHEAAGVVFRSVEEATAYAEQLKAANLGSRTKVVPLFISIPTVPK